MVTSGNANLGQTADLASLTKQLRRPYFRKARSLE